MLKRLGKKSKIAIVGISVVVFSFLASSYDNYFELSKNIEIFSTLFRELNVYYVDEIDPGKLTKKGIDAMLGTLDPYTNYYPESEIEDHRLQTTGLYGGIGAAIRKSGDYIVISDPYEGLPAYKAGLRAGDIILEIDGKSMKGKNTEDMVKVLRGAPNTSFKMLVKRLGIDNNREFTITREEIKIKNVPYFGMIDDEIGYIQLTGFTNNAGGEVRDALTELKKNNPKLAGVILDLRGNPGGLLREAINVVNVFVERNISIVQTKGKIKESNSEYKTMNAPVDTQIPLAVLINRGSASASEIVSGSMQDLDRGVIVGQRSFGKGLVQITRPLIYNTQLKVTTSKYHIPSGRCIQAVDYSKRKEDGSAIVISDTLYAKFKTKNGREVTDGAGIFPDLSIRPRMYSNILRSLIGKGFIFDYASIYRSQHDSISSPEIFSLTDAEYDDFVKFLEGKDYKYVTRSEQMLKEFEEVAKKEKYFDKVETEFKALKEKKESIKDNDLMNFKTEILEFLNLEIVSRYYHAKGRTKAALKTDDEVREAISILKDKDKYKSILSKDYQIKLIDYSKMQEVESEEDEE